jgi:PKD repeat protein
VPNKAPTASFSADCTDLDCTFDAAGSSDSDGSVVDYAWDFGDGSSGSGVTPTHSYAAGTYTVTLTIKDDDGATDSTSREVTAVPPNKPPVAAFTASGSGLAASFDGSASSDPDGRVASYAWSFGDGASGSGVSPSHTYTAGGAYQVALTVTDDDGATNSIIKAVTVVNPTLGLDSFTRTVTGGAGTADLGGPWSFSGDTGTSVSVSDGSAQITAGAGSAAGIHLDGVQNLSTDMTTTAWLPAAAAGGGVYFAASARTTAAGAYRARVKILPIGTVSLQMVRAVGLTDNLVGTGTTVSGISYALGMKLRIRTQVEGSSPTTVRGRVWVDGTPEPSTWTLSVTDSTAAMQTAGGVGLWAYATGTGGTQSVRFDDVNARMITPVPVR